MTFSRDTNSMSLQTIQCPAQEPKKSVEIDRMSQSPFTLFRKYIQVNLGKLLNIFWFISIFFLNFTLFLFWNNNDTSIYVIYVLKMMFFSFFLMIVSFFNYLLNPLLNLKLAFYEKFSKEELMIIKCSNLLLNILISFLTILNTVLCITYKEQNKI